MPLEIIELTMGPCRDFGLPGLEEVAGLPSPTAMPAYAKGLAEKLKAEGVVTEDEALYLADLVDTLAAAPGVARLLDEGKKREKALRLYEISRKLSLSATARPLGNDLLVVIGIILFNLFPSEKLADSLSGLGLRERPLSPWGESLSYEYNAMMALNKLLRDKPDEANAYADAALARAQDGDRRAYVKMLKGCIALRKGDPEAALGHLDDCEANDRLKARASFYAGIVRFDKKEFLKARGHFESAGARAKDLMDVLAVRCNVGACAVYLGDMGRGEEEFQEVNRSTWKKSGPRELHRKLLANSYMGIISRARGDYPEAENYYKEALKACVKLHDPVGIANQVGNMGLLHLSAGDPGTALRLFNACLLYSERMGYWNGIRFSCENIHGILVETGKAPEARRFKEMYTYRYPGLR